MLPCSVKSEADVSCRFDMQSAVIVSCKFTYAICSDAVAGLCMRCIIPLITGLGLPVSQADMTSLSCTGVSFMAMASDDIMQIKMVPVCVGLEL